MNNIIEITDFNSTELDIYARLTENQLLNRHEPDKGIFIAESPKVIERALDASCEPISILMEKKHIETQGRDILKRCGNIPVYTAEFDILTQLTGFKLTRGMLCAMRRPILPSIEDVCKDKKRIVVLENVMNPTNVGAIFRSAAALNMDAILLTTGCSNPLYRRAIRVSMGTVFQIPWTFINNTTNNKTLDNFSNVKNDIFFNISNDTENKELTTNYINKIRELGFKTAAMALDNNSVSIDDKTLNSEEKLAIILGTEGDGLAISTITDCDYTVKIPMSHGVDSLNVAAASAVAFWQLGKK